MLKWFKALGVAVLLAIPSVAMASHDGGVRHEIAVNTTDQLLNASGETSSILAADPNDVMTIFVSGTYGNANVVWVQKEVGSPGSGSWENFFQLNLGTANTRVVEGITNGPTPARYRLNMTNFDSGAVVAYMTNYPRAARTWTNDSVNLVKWDDFQITGLASATVLDVAEYVITEDSGGGGQGVPAVIDVSNREGGFTHLSDAGDGEEVCVGNTQPATNGSLVSDGWSVFEVRIALDVITGLAEMGFWDTICTADTVPITITAGTVAANGATAAIAAIVLDDGATASTSWQAVSAISNAEGANALEVPMVVAEATNYHILRLEIDNLGNAFFFVDNTLYHAEPLAVLTTSEIAAFVQIEATATAVAVTGTVDYWMVVHPRPTAPST